MPDNDFNPLVSFYPNAYENLPTEIEAAKFVADIKGGTYAGLVKEIRQRFQTAIERGVPYEDAKKAVDSLKKKLGSVTLAGIQPMRCNKFTPQFTGLIQADFDLLGVRLGYIRELLESDPHVFALFVSATGEGLKAFYRIPRCKNADEYKFAFDTLAAHVLKFTGCKIDELKEVARLCYASHDPDCRHNPNATELPVDFAQMPPPVEPKAERVKSQPQSACASTRSQIAENILGTIEHTDAGDFCKCPGEHLHTNGSTAKDCRVHLEGAPNVFCVHKSCASAVADTNKKLQSVIGKAEFVPLKSTPSLIRADVAGDPPDTANHFKSDVGYGDAFVKCHAQSIRYCADEKIWLVFDDVTGWRRDETGTAIKSLAADYARELYQAALTEAATKEPEIGKRIISNAASLGNKKRIDPALSFAACNPAVVVRAEQLDADPFLIGVQNGVVNLANGTFQAHRREHLVTRRLAVSFDANAAAPTWEKFLAEVQPEKEMRDFLQRLCGYALTGEIREHVLPFHYGTGANGKGTFLEHGLLKLAADYGAKLTDSLVYASDNGRLPHLELANLCGKRFALGEENSESGKLNEALLKSMTGGDRQKGRFHYGNFVEYAPSYKIALVGNHKPRIDGTDDGIWRRFLLVDWKVQIPEGQRDTQLKDKLAAEMPGILNWCIAGTRAWLADGLNPPESCKAATASFRDNSDKLAEFIAENFTADKKSYCTKAEVFAAYQQWANQQGIKYPMSKRALGVQLINRGWQEFKQGHENAKCWLGYRLQP